MSGRPRYGFELRQSAVELYEKGLGRASIAVMLGVPEETVRKWLDVYRSVGIEVLEDEGQTVAFESLSLDGEVVATHEDIDRTSTRASASSRSPRPISRRPSWRKPATQTTSSCSFAWRLWRP